MSSDYMVEVRIIASVWIGPTLYAAGDLVRLHVADAEALRNAGHVEIL